MSWGDLSYVSLKDPKSISFVTVPLPFQYLFMGSGSGTAAPFRSRLPLLFYFRHGGGRGGGGDYRKGWFRVWCAGDWLQCRLLSLWLLHLCLCRLGFSVRIVTNWLVMAFGKFRTWSSGLSLCLPCGRCWLFSLFSVMLMV